MADREDVIVDNIRFHWQWLFAPREQSGDNGIYYKYSATLIWEPDTETDELIEAGIRLAAVEKWGEKADGILKRLRVNDRLCAKDGDKKLTKEGDPTEGFEGMRFMNATSPGAGPETPDARDKPPMVRTNFGTIVTLENKGEFPRVRKTKKGEEVVEKYANNGDYGVVRIRFWAQDNEYGQRVNAELRTAMFKTNGDQLGGAADRSEEEDLNDLSKYVIEADPDDDIAPTNLFADEG